MTQQEKTRYQAEVMLAYANGAEIEYEHDTDRWAGVSDAPLWDWRRVNYRVKKPAPKVVKLEAWIDLCGELRHYIQDGTIPTSWKRIPSLDMQYVEDES